MRDPRWLSRGTASAFLLCKKFNFMFYLFKIWAEARLHQHPPFSQLEEYFFLQLGQPLQCFWQAPMISFSLPNNTRAMKSQCSIYSYFNEGELFVCVTADLPCDPNRHTSVASFFLQCKFSLLALVEVAAMGCKKSINHGFNYPFSRSPRRLPH